MWGDADKTTIKPRVGHKKANRIIKQHSIPGPVLHLTNLPIITHLRTVQGMAFLLLNFRRCQRRLVDEDWVIAEFPECGYTHEMLCGVVATEARLD